jgi:hypothetical protein
MIERNQDWGGVDPETASCSRTATNSASTLSGF